MAILCFMFIYTHIYKYSIYAKTGNKGCDITITFLSLLFWFSKNYGGICSFCVFWMFYLWRKCDYWRPEINHFCKAVLRELSLFISKPWVHSFTYCFWHHLCCHISLYILLLFSFIHLFIKQIYFWLLTKQKER